VRLPNGLAALDQGRAIRSVSVCLSALFSWTAPDEQQRSIKELPDVA
jgi:hypothetical protein